MQPTQALKSLSGCRWQHSQTLREKREQKPIHEHKSVPDGMESLIEGNFENLKESLLWHQSIGDVLKAKNLEWNQHHGKPEKETNVVAVSEESTVFDAIKLMTERKIGAVLVYPGQTKEEYDDAEFTGILTERDYMNKVILNGFDSRTTKVGRIMTSKPVTVRVEDSCLLGLQKMTNGKFRHIPVVKDGKIIGILSLADLVKSVLNSFKDSVNYLSQYVGVTTGETHGLSQKK